MPWPNWYAEWLAILPPWWLRLMGWYHLYVFIVIVLAAVILPTMVLAILVLYFGFGIRWGW